MSNLNTEASQWVYWIHFG